jgi:hypothetical protein
LVLKNIPGWPTQISLKRPGLGIPSEETKYLRDNNGGIFAIHQYPPFQAIEIDKRVTDIL